MKICVLVPNEEQTAQAGVRIRYRRIEPLLRAEGHELRVASMTDLETAADLTDDAYILSKCQDARGCVVARLLRNAGRLVGIDLFDDYYSQVEDSRFTRLRLWLATILPDLDFILCSTPAMRDLAATLAPGLPLHVMNDPAPRLDAEAVRFPAQRKLDHALRRSVIQVAWFGIGDHSAFSVGLDDLVAFGGELAKLRGEGFEVELGVLTNARAMTGDGLAMLSRLPVPYTVEEWTEERERLLLSRSLVTFLPVNAQNFSVVKSLNRAVSALCTGTQVLSSGYPLYESLAPFIYRDARRLLEDLKGRRLLVREETVPDLMQLLTQCADPAFEGRGLVDFLAARAAEKASAGPASAPAQAAVIQGRIAVGQIHKFAQRMGILSVGSPLCGSQMNFDVRFAFAPDGAGTEVFIAEKHCAALDPALQAGLAPHGRVVNTVYHKLDGAQLAAALGSQTDALARLDSSMSITASYPTVMAGVEQALQRLFPGVRCYYADQTVLPWQVERRA